MGAFTMRSSLNRLVLVMAAMLCCGCAAALGQTATFSNVGRTPSENEIRAWDIAISVEGKELPPGMGTAKEGAPLYAKNCVACHGGNLQGSPLGPPLMGGKGTLNTTRPMRSIGSYWPFAT